MKLNPPIHEYQVGNFHLDTREAARIVQRALPKVNGIAPKIIQRTIMEKIVR